MTFSRARAFLTLKIKKVKKGQKQLCLPFTNRNLGRELRNCCHKLKPTKTRHATSLLSDSPRLVVGGGLNLKLSELSCSHEWLWSGRRLEERCSKTAGSLCLLRHSVLSLAEVLPRTVLTETLRHWRYKHLDTITIRPPQPGPTCRTTRGVFT